MKIVPLPKDLREIESKVLKNLSKRQIIHILIAAPILFLVYLPSFAFLADEFTAGIIALIVVFPIFVNLFYKKEGMSFIEMFALRYLKEKKHKKIRFLNYKNLYLEIIENYNKKVKTQEN